MPDPKQCYQVNISTYTILKVVAVILVLMLLYSIKEVVGIIFVAWVFTSAIDPLIDRLQRHKIPRGVSILIVYFLVLVVISFFSMLLVFVFYYTILYTIMYDFMIQCSILTYNPMESYGIPRFSLVWGAKSREI